MDGMPFDAAVKILAENGIQSRELHNAVVCEGVSAFREFVIQPSGSAGAFILVGAKKEAQDPWVVYALYWYENWAVDAALPKLFREDKTRGVDFIDVSELK